jgi:hypothetical protein
VWDKIGLPPRFEEVANGPVRLSEMQVVRGLELVLDVDRASARIRPLGVADYQASRSTCKERDPTTEMVAKMPPSESSRGTYLIPYLSRITPKSDG